MRLAKPTVGKLVHAHHTHARILRGKFCQDLWRSIRRAVINGNNFQLRIVERYQSFHCGKKLLFFVTRCKKYRNRRTSLICSERIFLQSGQLKRAIEYAQSVRQPKKCDKSEERRENPAHELVFGEAYTVF